MHRVARNLVVLVITCSMPFGLGAQEPRRMLFFGDQVFDFAGSIRSESEDLNAAWSFLEERGFSPDSLNAAEVRSTIEEDNFRVLMLPFSNSAQPDAQVQQGDFGLVFHALVNDEPSSTSVGLFDGDVDSLSLREGYVVHRGQLAPSTSGLRQVVDFALNCGVRAGVCRFFAQNFVACALVFCGAEAAVQVIRWVARVVSEEPFPCYADGSNVRLREGPTLSATIITEMSNGTELDCYERFGDWFRVEIDGRVGYVHVDLLRLTAGPQ